MTAGLSLDIGRVCADHGRYAVDGELLESIYVLASAVVTPPGIALGVLVGQDGALCLHDGQRREVLTCNHLQRSPLTRQFGVDGGGDLRVEHGQRLRQDAASLPRTRFTYADAHCN